MYETMYAQQVEDDIAARDHESPYRLNRDPKLLIRPFSDLVAASATSENGPVTLEITNRVTHITTTEQFDVVICGTG
jgi:lysine/ornithine N-monooxygenase